jgi:hypothetical protein
VAAGDIHPFEVRVNLPALAAQVRRLQAAGILRTPAAGSLQPSVAGFGSFLKKVGRAVTHNKVSKAVGKVVTKVAKSPIVQIANPMMAVTTHTISKAATGKGTLEGKLGTAIDLGTAVVVPHGLAHVGPQALAALGVGAKAVLASQTGKTIASMAKQAQKVVNQGKQAAALVQAGRLTASAAAPLIKKAVNVRATIPKIAPKLAIKAADAKKVQAAIKNVASKAKAGSVEAKKAAVAIASAAKMVDKISAAEQAAAGGNAGFVITAQGKIRKAPKGKFVRNKALPVIETLYRGAKVAPLQGSFTAVSGKRSAVSNRRSADSRRPMADPHERPTLVPADYRALEAEVYRALVEDEYQRDTLPAPPPSSRKKTRVSGHSAWGGGDDPGDEYDGPLAPVRYNDPTTWPVNPLDPDHVSHPVEAYEHSIAGTRNFLGLVAGSRPRTSCLKPHGWRGAPGTTAAARDRAKSLLELARARHHLQKVLKRTKVGNDMASIMVGADLIVGDSEDVGTPPEMTESSDGLSEVDLIVSGASGHGTNELIGCGEPNISGAFPGYLLTSKGLRHPVIRRRVKAWLKSLTPKVRRRVMSRLPAIVGHNDIMISGAIRSANPTVGHYGPGWAAVSGIPGGYELVGSHRQAGILTP